MSKGIREGDLVRLHNIDSHGERQEMLLQANIDSGLRDGDVFVPIHWNDQFAANSRVICSCFRVTEQQISAAIDKGARSAEDLGRALRCGTNCGSCIPELKQLLARQSRAS